MTNQPEYHDIRSEFWSSCWGESADYDAYLERSEERRASNWTSLARRLPPLGSAQAERLVSHHRTLNVLVVSGVWCGDCVRQGPMLDQIARSCGDDVSLRLIDRDQNADLRDEVRILGAARVPVAVFLSEDFHEVGRFGDRMLTTYRRKAKTELGGAACPVPTAAIPAGELERERDEWVDVFERMLLMVRLAPPLRQRHGD